MYKNADHYQNLQMWYKLGFPWFFVNFLISVVCLFYCYGCIVQQRRLGNVCLSEKFENVPMGPGWLVGWLVGLLVGWSVFSAAEVLLAVRLKHLD